MLNIQFRVISQQYFKKIFPSLYLIPQHYSYTGLSNFNLHKNVRFYLSPAYNCVDKWNYRFQDPFIKDVKPGDYYFELIRKYKRDGKVASIDADIFINSITKEDVDKMVEEMEEVVHILRRSPETIHTLPSTHHAVMRLLLEANKYDLILKLISDPMNFGIFLDFYTANLFMATFLKAKNFTAAARVASTLMLQEDYGPPLTKSLVLLSCFKYAFNPEENLPWTDYNPVYEPEEEVKILVRYIRNYYFDDHFDIKEPWHIVGKTLAWLSFHLEDPLLKSSSAVLGWSLYEKWSELISALELVLHSKEQLDEILFNKISEQIKACKDAETKLKLEALVAKIVEIKLVSNLGLMETLENHVATCCQKHENECIEAQEKTYDEWAIMRKESVAKYQHEYEKMRLIKEIKTKKEDLQKREEVIFYFENQNTIDLLTPVKRVPRPHVKSIKRSKDKKGGEAEYIPPEV